MKTVKELQNELRRIDGKGYKAYKDIQDSYQFDNFTLHVEYVQGDPFASPSKLIVKIPQEVAGFPADTYSSRSREIALRDYLTRQFAREANRKSNYRGSGKSGLISIDKPGQEILERTSVFIDKKQVEARFTVGLPARGRKVLGRQAEEMLTRKLPEIVHHSLFYENLDSQELEQHIKTNEDADALRNQLTQKDLVAFVADGAVLPRRSGVDPRPLGQNAVPFNSPGSLRVNFSLPNQGKISGMGIPKGITLIVGGGYHGKSTLLEAMELGIYNHIPEDGREFVVTDPEAVKIRSEDGRSIENADISPFINNLPHGLSTQHFSSPNASGSTSQAANIVEMLEVGASTLLIDEDTSATNFMIRDQRMQELVAKEKEPITPFVDKVRQLSDEENVSTVLVMGGSGDYFDVADTVIAMDTFEPYDVTENAKQIAKKHSTRRQAEGGEAFGEIKPRRLVPQSIDPSKGKKGIKTKTRGTDHIQFGQEDIDLSAVEQLIDESQARSIAEALVHLKKHILPKQDNLAKALAELEQTINKKGLGEISPFMPHNLASVRRFEIAAALNRLRSLSVQ